MAACAQDVLRPPAQEVVDALSALCYGLCRRSAYRVTKYVADQRGYLLRDADGKERPFYLQGKSQLRPGQRVTLFHLLKSFYLDKLSVAGGEGAPLLADAKRIALSTHH
jgi:hypothetical protein